MWFSQTDKRWAKEKLGFSNLTIGGFGCTITSLSNWLQFFGINQTPSQVNQRLQDVKGFAKDKQGNQCLVVWSKLSKAYPQMNWKWRGYNYDNVRVAWQVYVKKTPVLVEVQLKTGRHWVLFIGNKKMIDPLIGGERPTTYWPLTGYSLIDKV